MQFSPISMYRLLSALVGASLLSCTRQAPPSDGAAHASTTDSAATEFVSSFYRAYWPRGYASATAFDSVLATSPELFAPELRTALQRDASARAATRGEVGGIDWEPVMGGQDPCPHFRLGETRRIGSRVRVAIVAVCQQGYAPDSPVTAEVAYVGKNWAFTNFIYAPPAGDLLHALRTVHP